MINEKLYHKCLYEYHRIVCFLNTISLYKLITTPGLKSRCISDFNLSIILNNGYIKYTRQKYFRNKIVNTIKFDRYKQSTTSKSKIYHILSEVQHKSRRYGMSLRNSPTVTKNQTIFSFNTHVFILFKYKYISKKLW